jgi:Polyketide cyclase / dehydrase and lipid transport
MSGTTVSVDRVINAPASAIFAIVSDASRHPEIDGSGSVVKLNEGSPEQLHLGSVFGMSMKLGVPYSMSNTVIEFEPDRCIAWQTRVAGPLGRFLGGRIWRYKLEDTADGTKVTETWDISQDKQGLLLRSSRVAQQFAGTMSKTLDKLAALTESPAQGSGPASAS